MKKDTLAKYQWVREGIIQAMRSGELRAGQLVPGERELAERFGVSRMTARRAVKALVEADLLRRTRNRTYIRQEGPQKLGTVTLNIVWLPHGNAQHEAFLRLALDGAERRGWKAHVVRLQHEGNNLPALRAIQSGELTLAWLPLAALRGPLGRAMSAASGRAVLLGNRLDDWGVSCVLADNTEVTSLAVKHLQRMGHRDIALLSGPTHEPNVQVEIAAWRACCLGQVAPQIVERRLIVVESPRPGSPCLTRAAYEVVRRHLSSNSTSSNTKASIDANAQANAQANAGANADVSALICLSDELALGAMAACHDIGRAVPQGMSLVNCGDSALMQFARPAITVVDLDLERHIELALEMLQATAQKPVAPVNSLGLVQPRLVKRYSVLRRLA